MSDREALLNRAQAEAIWRQTVDDAGGVVAWAKATGRSQGHVCDAYNGRKPVSYQLLGMAGLLQVELFSDERAKQRRAGHGQR